MTEWNGIKVGGLYTDKMDKYCGEPAVMMCIAIRRCLRTEDGNARVTFLWRGLKVEHTVPSDWTGWNDWCVPEYKADLANGPYTVVAE